MPGQHDGGLRRKAMFLWPLKFRGQRISGSTVYILRVVARTRHDLSPKLPSLGVRRARYFTKGPDRLNISCLPKYHDCTTGLRKKMREFGPTWMRTIHQFRMPQEMFTGKTVARKCRGQFHFRSHHSFAPRP